MKGVVCSTYGPPEVLKITDIPKPDPKSNELLIRIKATTVNSGDVRVRSLDVEGFMRVVMRVVLGFTKPRKPVLGTVCSGIVEAVGDKVTLFKPGDEVFGMTGFNFGTYAEYIALPETSPVLLKPSGASFESAAAIVFGGSSALYFLEKAKLGTEPDQNVLIYGATGSVGTSAIQVAKYHKAKVTAVCSAAGTELAKSLGADTLIDYQQQDFKECGEKFDIVFDAVGKTNQKECKGLLKPGGVFVTVGGMDVASETKEMLETLSKMFQEGLLKDVIDKTYSIDQIVEAHRYVDSGHKKGNVVITL
jgi:NADPH:quinone reductase and related Zn-dependent oxidoreductases